MDWFFSVIGQVSLTISDYGTASGRVPHQFICRPHLFIICCNYPVVFKPSIVNCSSPVFLLTSVSTATLVFYVQCLSRFTCLCSPVSPLELSYSYALILIILDWLIIRFIDSEFGCLCLFLRLDASECPAQGYLATDWRSPGSSHQPSD